MKPSNALHRNMHRLILSQALSKLGDNFSEVALALFVLSITHRNVAALGVVLAMAYVPRVTLGWTVAGFIERLPKRRAMLVSNGARALLVASIPVLHHYWWTVAAVFLMYCFSMVYQPLLQSIQPQIAGSPEVNAQGMARLETYYSVADMGAYIAAGGVLFFWGVGPAFGIDAATYVGAGVLVWSLNVDPDIWAHGRHAGASFWAQIKEGIVYLRERRRIKELTMMSGVVALAAASVNTLLAPMSRMFWHVSADHYVWLLLGLAVGSFVSGMAVERMGLMQRWSRQTVLALGFLLTVVGFGLTVLLHTWVVGAMSLGLVGVGNVLFSTALMVWVQESAPTEIRARIMAIRGVGLGAGGAVGSIAIGWLARAEGLKAAVLVGAAIWLVLTLWVLLSKGLRAEVVRQSAA